MSGCRIGRVKMKGGAEIVKLPTAHRDDVQRDLVDWAVQYAKSYEPGEMHGFIMIVWDAERTQSVAYLAKSSFVHGSNAPAFAAEETRRALVAQGVY